MKKTIIFGIVFLICISSVLALEECKGTMDFDEVPCYVLLPVNTTVNPCNTITVEFYNTSDSLYNVTMSEYNFFKCNATFNQTDLGTYVFRYSTGDTGSIIVDGGRTMELLIYFGLIISFLALVIGLVIKDKLFLNVSGMLFIGIGVFITINGFATLSNLLTMFISIILWGIGGYIFIGTNIDQIQELLG